MLPDLDIAAGPHRHADSDYGRREYQTCWAARWRRDRSLPTDSRLSCGAPSETPSGLCRPCHRLLTAPTWWDRLKHRTTNRSATHG